MIEEPARAVMLSQVKKLSDPRSRKEIAGRFGAWWDGREYVAEVDDGADADGAETAGEGASVAAKPAVAIAEIVKAEPEADGPRIAALERMWGVGRFGPDLLDGPLLDALEQSMPDDGDVGMMGADPALLRAWAGRSDRNLYASEWRSGALDRVRKAVPEIAVIDDDVDRLKAFPEDALAALASVNTMSFADHKPGLVSCAWNALKDGGRWVVVDMVRTTPKTPDTAFASAWAEPQLAEEAEFDALLEKAGFGEIRKLNLTQQMIGRVREQLAELGAALEQTVAEGMNGGGALFLREFVWELKSWRARLKALEGGALQVVMWTVVKGGTPGAVVADAEDEGEAPAGDDGAADEVTSDAAPEADEAGDSASAVDESTLFDELAAAVENSQDASVDEALFDEKS